MGETSFTSIGIIKMTWRDRRSLSLEGICIHIPTFRVRHWIAACVVDEEGRVTDIEVGPPYSPAITRADERLFAEAITAFVKTERPAKGAG